MNDRSIAAIYAVSENHVIGKDNDIPWRLSADLKRFKQLTMGHPILMGRKTYESIGKPLPGRPNVIISRNPNFLAEGCLVQSSLESAIGLYPDQDIFLIGGAGIYREGIEAGHVDTIHQTLVHAEVDGDVVFELDMDQWKIVEVDAHQADDKNEFAYTFRTLKRISP